MDLQKEYALISRSLISMKEEYKIMPTNFLEKQIEYASKKLKAIDAAMPKNT